MLSRIVRPAAFAVSLTAFFTFVACTGGSNRNTNTAANTNAAAANTNAKADSTKTAEQEVSALLDEYNDALLKSDAAALDRMWADDLSFVNLHGQLLNKKERLENIKSGATEIKKAVVSEKNVRMYGDTAVATLVVKIDGQYSGKDGDGSSRITTVWAKPKGTWQMVATQMTLVAR